MKTSFSPFVVIPSFSGPKHVVIRKSIRRAFQRGHEHWRIDNDHPAICITGALLFGALKFILDDEACVYTTMRPHLPERSCFEYQGVFVIRKEGRGTESDGFTFV